MAKSKKTGAAKRRGTKKATVATKLQKKGMSAKQANALAGQAVKKGGRKKKKSKK
jgi:hypothetical protein